MLVESSNDGKQRFANAIRMNTHALSVLEFQRALDQVAGSASSEHGASRVRASMPTSDVTWIQKQQAEVTATRALISSEAGWTLPLIPSVKAGLDRLRIEGASLSATHLSSIGQLFRSSRLVKESLADVRHPAAAVAVLQHYADELIKEYKVESTVTKAIDIDGEVRDDASPELRRIRRELRGAEGNLVALLERVMSRLEPHQQVSDMSVTIRNGRYVIPVRREGRVAVGGIVHDTSGTGGTIFVEPPAAIEAGNRIRELEADELREIDRILAELSDLVRPFYGQLSTSAEVLVTLDSLYARARYAIKYNCTSVDLCDPTAGFSIIDGRHPLLMAQGVDVVPFSLTLNPNERTLLVSGPNTGGKTVLLKATALISLMVQCGIPVPVKEGSTVAVFDDVYADIGDEQSIEASLSTFSAHVKNLREILLNATRRTLVLIDELGSGTDPVEGAAIGGAVLESLTERNSLTIATTHLGSLKELAIEHEGIVNASLQFDPVALAPTYKLIKGIPGRSYGISIARRLNMPEAVLARAEERLPTGERDANALLADLEAREEALTALEREMREGAEDLKARLKQVSERERRAGIKERELERESRKETRKYLLEARKEIEGAIKALADSTTRNQSDKHTQSDSVDAAIKDARRLVERLVVGQNQQLERLERSETGAKPGKTGKKPANSTILVVGDRVKVSTLGEKVGQIVDLRSKEAVVAVGELKLTVALRNLEKIDYTPPPIAVQVRGDIPEVNAENEVDLRGMRVGDIDDLLVHALDNAIRADLKTLRIIHGKGTGALRERVNAMLKAEPRVSNYRLGAWNEGGAGVTVVEF